MRKQTWAWIAILGASTVGTGCGDDWSPAAPGDVAPEATAATVMKTKPTQFFVPPPTPAALKQVADLIKARHIGDALKLAAMATTPRAVWFLSGSPEEVQTSVRQTMTTAAHEDRVPVLVAYNIPFRDCAQYSSGGATDSASYAAWIDGFARGIGNGTADVILEPDSLGIIPYNTTIFGSTEWCMPTVTDATGATVPAPGSSADERYAQLRGAIATLAAKAPHASVYIDGSHSAWLGVSEAAYRIHKAGFDATTGAPQVKGFYLNVSNYQPTDQLIQFGTWVSQCLAATTVGASWAIGNFKACPGQYDPATNYTTVNYTAAFEATITAGLANILNGAAATMPFVIDTSRNGRGPLDATPYAAAPYNQPADVIAGLNGGDWCNAPGAGAGLRPSASTGVALVDAYLWVKEPGDSDGSCDIAGGARAWDYAAYDPWAVTGDAQNHFDPLWGVVDPPAGTWFPAQALQLAQLAVPPLF